MKSADQPPSTYGASVKTTLRALPISLDAIASFDSVIDVRSPGEFTEDHLPGAVNFPVLSDAERVRVGTIYKQRSAFEAKKIGAALVARNIALHIESSFLDKPKGWKPLIYCWRGGSRSGAMVHVMRSIGWPAMQLEGGHKGWRGQVISELASLPANFSFRVICGRTGSGKSRLLEALNEFGSQVLDLEKLAMHKGSVLGDLPGERQPAQKFFETCVWAALSGFDANRPVYVEAESKKVGSVRVPEALILRMRESTCIEVKVPDALRVRLLREEYAHLIANNALLFDKLDCLSGLHSPAKILEWKALATSGKWDEFVADMLAYHYDPAYSRSMFKNFVYAENATPLIVKDISTAHFSRLARSLPSCPDFSSQKNCRQS